MKLDKNQWSGSNVLSSWSFVRSRATRGCGSTGATRRVGSIRCTCGVTTSATTFNFFHQIIDLFETDGLFFVRIFVPLGSIINLRLYSGIDFATSFLGLFHHQSTVLANDALLVHVDGVLHFVLPINHLGLASRIPFGHKRIDSLAFIPNLAEIFGSFALLSAYLVVTVAQFATLLQEFIHCVIVRKGGQFVGVLVENVLANFIHFLVVRHHGGQDFGQGDHLSGATAT